MTWNHLADATYSEIAPFGAHSPFSKPPVPCTAAWKFVVAFALITTAPHARSSIISCAMSPYVFPDVSRKMRPKCVGDDRVCRSPCTSVGPSNWLSKS